MESSMADQTPTLPPSTTKIYPTAVEAVDAADTLLFTVEMYDEHCATVDIKQTTHDLASWEALARDVTVALGMLGLTSQEPKP